MIGSHLESDQQPSLTRELRLVQSPGEMLTGSSISSEVSSGICDEGTIAGAQGDSSILLDEGGKDGKTGDEKDEVCEKPVVGVPITVDHSSLEDPVKGMFTLIVIEPVCVHTYIQFFCGCMSDYTFCDIECMYMHTSIITGGYIPAIVFVVKACTCITS